MVGCRCESQAATFQAQSKQGITISGDQSEIKLVTCYPFNTVASGGSLRYVVSAQLTI
jgi:hypothetical protein